MLVGIPPYYSDNLSVLYKKITRGKLKIPNYVSPHARNLVLGLLTKNPKDRLGYRNMSELKEHMRMMRLRVLLSAAVP